MVEKQKYRFVEVLLLMAVPGSRAQVQEGFRIRVLTLVELVIALVIRKAISEVTTRAKQAIVTINGKYPIC
jgi:hypothetical protein